jgi:hypothetical protein
MHSPAAEGTPRILQDDDEEEIEIPIPPPQREYVVKVRYEYAGRLLAPFSTFPWTTCGSMPSL